MSTASTIRTGVKTALSAITPANGYTSDLSGASQVIFGSYGLPTLTGKAQVMIADWSLAIEHDAQLGLYRHTVTYTILGWAPATASTLDEKDEAATVLLDDVVKALRKMVRNTSGSLYGTVLDVLVRDAGPIGGLEGEVAAGWGCFGAVVEVWYKANSEAGI